MENILLPRKMYTEQLKYQMVKIPKLSNYLLTYTVKKLPQKSIVNMGQFKVVNFLI